MPSPSAPRRLRAPGRPARIAAVTAAALLVLVGPLGRPAGAEPGGSVVPGAAALPSTPPADPSADPPAPLPDLRPLEPLSAGLDQVRVRSAAYDVAAGQRDEAERTISEARSVEADSQASLLRLTARRHALTIRIAFGHTTVDRLVRRTARIRAALKALAVTGYIESSDLSDRIVLDPTGHKQLDVGRERNIRETVDDAQRADLARTGEQQVAARKDLSALLGARAEVDRETRDLAARRLEALHTIDEASHRLIEATLRVNETGRTAMVVGTDLPLVVLDAYARASDLLAVIQPACRISWWALAGIGATESGQGTFGGSEVRADGTLTRPIFGIALSGAPGVAHIGDTDGGALDGDPTIDRAVGPMQFIPSSWRSWALDGDGDQIADPQNLYDAAATAAAYLCHSGALDNDEGLGRAYLSYNASFFYVVTVLDRAHSYRDRLSIPGR
jgi:membrane-bound lytic murein transglycosylase B